jgi:hypothetical protein
MSCKALSETELKDFRILGMTLAVTRMLKFGPQGCGVMRCAGKEGRGRWVYCEVD